MNSSGQRLRVLFAASEAAPVARVGGLAEAAAGLIRALRKHDAVELVVVLPDYGDVELENVTSLEPSTEDRQHGGTVITEPTHRPKGILTRLFNRSTNTTVDSPEEE